MISEVRDWLNFVVEVGIFVVVTMEYFYDRDKDLEKKQRKVRTTKKVTTQPGGATTTEETKETVEPAEQKQEGS